MRRCHEQPQFLRDEHANLVGLKLEADFAAEHEWGIKLLRKCLGTEDIDSKNPLDYRQQKGLKPGEDILYEEKSEKAVLLLNWLPWRSASNADKGLFDLLPMDISKPYWPPAVTFTLGAWDEKSFGVLVKGEKNKQMLKTVYDQFLAKNTVVYKSGMSFIGNGALIVLFADKARQYMQELQKKEKKAGK